MRGAGRLAILVPVLVGLAACSAAEPPEKRVPRPVPVITVKAADIPMSASLTGTIAAQVQQDLAFRAGGQVESLTVDVGDHVQKGDIIARLDPRDLKAEADLAAASVTSANAQLVETKASYERQKALYANGNTTRANLDSARTAFDSAKSALASAEADAASARETLSYADLVATDTGIVVARNVETGQVVQAGQAVFTIAVDGPRDAVFQTYERALVGEPFNTPVTVSLLANPKTKAIGHLREYAPALDAASGTVKMKVGLDAGAPFMPLGASVTGAVALSPVHGYALPWSALSRNEKGPAVWIVDPKTDIARLVPVTIDRYLDKLVVIGAGLADGDTVVTGGLSMLRPGEKVAPTDTKGEGQ